MKPSSDSNEKSDKPLPSLDFQLPEGEDFHSLPPRIPLADFVRRNEELRRWFPNSVPTAEERWRAKTTDEFRIKP